VGITVNKLEDPLGIEEGDVIKGEAEPLI